jgi:hypothetical protein
LRAFDESGQPRDQLGDRQLLPAKRAKYFLAQALSGGLVTPAVLNSQLTGTLRTAGTISPFGSINAQSSERQLKLQRDEHRSEEALLEQLPVPRVLHLVAFN